MTARPASVLILAFTLGAACSGKLPTLDGLSRIGRSALPIGPEKEHEIGFGIAAMVAGRYPVLEDEALTRYVNFVGRTVAQQSIRLNEVAFRFGVLDTDDVNAFAAPGGYILVTRGALARMASEAELAGVLAHEVAHVDQLHVLDEIRRSSVFTGVREEADLSGEVIDRLGEIGSTLLFTGLSRDDELEADSLGLLYAAASGYRPDGLLLFLDRVHGAPAGVGTREWTATHPSGIDRAAALRRQMAAAGLQPATGKELVERFREGTARISP